MKKKNVTIGDLAIMVKKGFEGVDLRFDSVDERLDSIGERLEKTEKLVLEDHDRRIEKLEAKMDEIREALAIK